MAETELAYTLVTKAQLKIELGIDTGDTDDDDRIIRAENAATEYCESYTNRKLRQRSADSTEYHDSHVTCAVSDDGAELWPDEWPFASTDITSLEDDATRAYDGSTYLVTDYVVYFGRFIRRTSGAFNTESEQSIKLVYQPGYSTLPTDLVKAATLIALDFYRLEKNQHGNISTADLEGHNVTYREYEINPTAQAILDLYKRTWKGKIPDQKAWLR